MLHARAEVQSGAEKIGGEVVHAPKSKIKLEIYSNEEPKAVQLDLGIGLLYGKRFIGTGPKYSYLADPKNYDLVE